MGYSPRGRKESNMTERLHFHFPWWLSEKQSAFIAGDSGDMGSIPGLG